MARRNDLFSFEKAAIIQFFLKEAKVENQLEARSMLRCKTGVVANERLVVFGQLQINKEQVVSLELSKRSTIKRLACEIKCSKSTVGIWIKSGLIIPHSSAIKPDLTAPNKLLRLQFSLEALEYDRILRSLTFKSMHNTVHIDGKWFYIIKSAQKFYLIPEEIEPHRTCKNKKFMCAVCRPVFGADGVCLFDEKIGIFPFNKLVPAKRNSKNMAVGTMEWKPIQSIIKQVVKDCLIYKIIPAIKAKWPANASKTIYMAIQSLQTESMSTNVDGLVNVVINSLNELSPTTLNKVFLSLQSCMVEILKVKGRNRYKIPHLGKDALIRQDMLPLNLQVPSEFVRECISYLIDNRALSISDTLMKDLGVHAGCTDEVEMMVHELQIQRTEVM
ncbi:uncharacterized protein LOC131018765 [Salvia miltiorrhiza]|uniref:uncharacterized protein LOC131018765 n=1 Tax=Salvia miltiorrhiza TaxID=226208 RepID=UPI0025AC3E46|nr:uncharacterized protein LOC131018765 [Salvia miltiorrhiza]